MMLCKKNMHNSLIAWYFDSTRPDIAYVVDMLSRYTYNPTIGHWDAISKLLRYLKGIINFGLSYYDYSPLLKGYCDANWISDSDELKCLLWLYWLSLGGPQNRLACQGLLWSQS